MSVSSSKFDIILLIPFRVTIHRATLFGIVWIVWIAVESCGFVRELPACGWRAGLWLPTTFSVIVLEVMVHFSNSISEKSSSSGATFRRMIFVITSKAHRPAHYWSLKREGLYNFLLMQNYLHAVSLGEGNRGLYFFKKFYCWGKIAFKVHLLILYFWQIFLVTFISRHWLCYV